MWDEGDQPRVSISSGQAEAEWRVLRSNQVRLKEISVNDMSIGNKFVEFEHVSIEHDPDVTEI